MSHSSSDSSSTLSTPRGYTLRLPLPLGDIYRDIHAHPELGFQEHRTAGLIAEALELLGVRVVSGIAGTGVVGVIENGEGQTVLLRADMDALPIEETTGLDYASRARGVGADGHEVPLMHACGHDMHVAAQLGAVEELLRRRDEWSGTVLALFQPAEEGGGGAQAMIDDGLYERLPVPDVVLGQHLTTLPVGQIALRPGLAMSAADTFDVTMHGRGGHGSRPEETVDPVMMAASTALRLQGIVSREISAFDSAVVTIGKLNAGTKHNIIADHATLGISVRTFDADVRERVLTAIERIVQAEASASGAPRAPEIDHIQSYPLTTNDEAASARVLPALVRVVGEENVIDPGVSSASDDVGVLAIAAGVPLVFWYLGMNDPETVAAGAPPHHTSTFAPVPEATLATGVAAMTEATVEWLAR